MRIGIVNDSVMACEVLRRVVLSVPGQEVAWIARDGEQAVAMTRADGPDVILMDLFMPGTDGVEATRRIMNESPCAILVVTATVSGHISKVYQAMGSGALDAVDTPVLGTGGEVAGAASLLRKIDVIGKLIGKTPPRMASLPPSAPVEQPIQEPALYPLVLLGSSTGGPFALAEILSKLPASLKTTIVIVQHVDAAFAPGLGQWLSQHAGRKVELIRDGMELTEGKILLSGTDDHLVLGAHRRLYYSAEPRALTYRPSIDVFFKSVAGHWPRSGVAALLTGMGRDGAEGLLQLRRLGWKTIAQDELTSVVWGMPGAAVALGAADQVLPLPLIGQAIASFFLVPNPSQVQARPTSF
ncbi:MAG: chemotaxis response regulator protein-glutamate methylesterase [Planctomycetaceae bacterium]|nr:chemotaxis response regulator protein-glutamate methylesterase [Planctomycetaceae bacterium]